MTCLLVSLVNACGTEVLKLKRTKRVGSYGYPKLHVIRKQFLRDAWKRSRQASDSQRCVWLSRFEFKREFFLRWWSFGFGGLLYEWILRVSIQELMTVMSCFVRCSKHLIEFNNTACYVNHTLGIDCVRRITTNADGYASIWIPCNYRVLKGNRVVIPGFHSGQDSRLLAVIKML